MSLKNRLVQSGNSVQCKIPFKVILHYAELPLQPSRFLSDTQRPTISQKNSETNPLPRLINVAGFQNMCSFLFFLFPCFHNIDQEGRGCKVFIFDSVKIFLVVPLYFLTDCLKTMGKKSSNIKSPIFFSKPIRKSNIVRSQVSIYAVALIDSTIP